MSDERGEAVVIRAPGPEAVMVVVGELEVTCQVPAGTQPQLSVRLPAPEKK